MNTTNYLAGKYLYAVLPTLILIFYKLKILHQTPPQYPHPLIQVQLLGNAVICFSGASSTKHQICLHQD